MKRDVTPSKLESSDRRRLARRLCVLYHHGLRSAVMGYSVGGMELPVRKLRDVDKTAQDAFLRAASLCHQIGADPREFVVAQFRRWAEVSAYRGAQLYPQPAHLASVGAQVRYLEYVAKKGERLGRKAPKVAGFDREERKLRGLSRSMRQRPEDVLAAVPEEFSRAFLEHKHVWPLVADAWTEGHAS